MLSIAAITSAAYYTSATTAEYFQEGGNSPGRWWGPAARSLRVRGEVTAPKLERLLLGLGADGAALVQQQQYRDGRSRQAAWDLTFSAPKSVSIIWSQATPSLRKRLVAAHREAVTEALDYLQHEAAWTRRGKGGATRETVRLVGALFDHHTNRELEPHLHTHVVLPNLGVREDGTTGTILSQPLYRHKMAAGALYRAGLDHALQRELGLKTRRSGTSFEVRGVSRELIDAHSQRRQQIKKALAAKGLASARASAVATLDTRRTKQAQSLDALQPGWQAINARLGLTADKLEALLGRQKNRNQDRNARRAVTRAIREITEHANTFSSRELVTASSAEALSRGVSAKKLAGAVQQALANARQTIALGELDGERRLLDPPDSETRGAFGGAIGGAPQTPEESSF